MLWKLFSFHTNKRPNEEKKEEAIEMKTVGRNKYQGHLVYLSSYILFFLYSLQFDLLHWNIFQLSHLVRQVLWFTPIAFNPVWLFCSFMTRHKGFAYTAKSQVKNDKERERDEYFSSSSSLHVRLIQSIIWVNLKVLLKQQ